ncbi:MAG: glycosyltransferase [Thermodesulfobacteriota bacterium]
MKDLCVCILAHNEQKHIAETIGAIAENCGTLDLDIKVYANGCTDNTEEIVRSLCRGRSNLYLRELRKPSKANAWNVAFSENKNPILVFADGDVVPEAGAIEALYGLLTKENKQTVVVGCSFWPRKAGLTWGQRFTGFLQIPVRQDFLAGGLYAIRRQGLAQEFAQRNIDGIPSGVTGDDTFLQLVVPPDRFSIISHRVYYEPPELEDYWKYLARIRWQEEQLFTVFSALFTGPGREEKAFGVRMKEKIAGRQGAGRLLLGLMAGGARSVMKTVFRKKIDGCYRALGPVGNEGGNVLSRATRSQSAK